MKRKCIETGRDLLVIFNNHIMLVAFCFTAIGLMEQNSSMLWLWTALFAVPILFYFFRVKVSNFFLFFVLHFMSLLVISFLPITLWAKILSLFVGVFYLIWSLNIRFRNKEQGESVFAPIFMTGGLTLFLIIESSFCHRDLEGVYIALAIIFAAGYCIYVFLDHYLKFIYLNESSAANIPEKEIFINGFGQSAFCIIGMVLFLTLTANVNLLGRIMSWLGDVLFDILKYVLSKVVGAEEQGTVSTTVERPPLPMMDIVAEPEKTSVFWEILDKILVNLMTICMVGLILFTIVKGMQYIWKKFHETNKGTDDAIEEGVDVREVCEIEKKHKDVKQWRIFRSNRDKVRKIYQKQILKQKKYIIGEADTHTLEYMTAKECCDTLAADKLKEIYEKVRYSDDEITAEDVKITKDSLR